MDRLISEKSVMEVIYGCDWFIDEEHAEVIKERIKAIPSAEPKTGHWIEDDITERSKSAYKHKCDRCGAYHRAMYDYCPSCGARMVEPQAESEDTE